MALRIKLQTRRALAYARKGMAGAYWYDAVMDLLRDQYGQDAQLMAAFIAATSPNTTVQANVTLAVKAYNQWKTGQPFTGYLPITIANLERAAKGQPLKGLKVSHFHRAIVGDPMAVTVDRWMIRAYGYEQATPARMDAIIEHCQRVAGRYGLQPRQLQAAIWTGIKGTPKDADSLVYCLMRSS